MPRRGRHAKRTCLPLFSTLQHLAILGHACAILRLRKCGLCAGEAQAFQPLLEACWLVLTAAVVCFSGESILALFAIDFSRSVQLQASGLKHQSSVGSTLRK
jgi:hypothetical protein